MRARWFDGRGVAGTVVLALLLVAALATAASAEDSYAAVAGTWVGPVAWPSGSTEITTWTINRDGTFSIQTDAYTAVGALTAKGTDYAFSYERAGQTYKGVLAGKSVDGRNRLVGRGEDPYGGPMNITLTQSH